MAGTVKPGVGDMNDSVQQQRFDSEPELERHADDAHLEPSSESQPEPQSANASDPGRAGVDDATNYHNDTLPDTDDTPFNRLDYVKTFVKVTSKENTSDKVVLVDFFAE